MIAILMLAMTGFVDEPPAPARPFVVKIVDDETLRGIPLVELRTINNVRYVTDSSGLAAIDDPGLEGQTSISS